MRSFISSFMLTIGALLIAVSGIITVKAYADSRVFLNCTDAGNCVGAGIPGLCHLFNSQCTPNHQNSCRCDTNPIDTTKCQCWSFY
jgi:hypothetical protein